MSTQSQPIIPVTIPYDGMNNRSYDNHQNTNHLFGEIHRSGSHTIDHIDAKEGRDFTARSEIRQNIERNADQISSQANSNSIAGLLATQNTSTATQLAVQNTATATQLGVQSSSTATQLGVQNTATATQLGVQNTSSNIQMAIRDSTAQSAALLSALSVQAERINGLNVVESKNIQVNQGRDLGATQLLQTQQFATLQLQASENKAFLTNYICNTADKGDSKLNALMAKLSDCCCENKLLHSATQNAIIANELATLRATMK